MPSLYILGLEEFEPIIEIGRQNPGVSERRIGSYVELSTDGTLSIDRKATGTRHAIWYSCVGGIRDGHLAQFDKDQLRVVPDNEKVARSE
jgi:hypothetical protein